MKAALVVVLVLLGCAAFIAAIAGLALWLGKYPSLY